MGAIILSYTNASIILLESTSLRFSWLCSTLSWGKDLSLSYSMYVDSFYMCLCCCSCSSVMCATGGLATWICWAKDRYICINYWQLRRRWNPHLLWSEGKIPQWGHRKLSSEGLAPLFKKPPSSLGHEEIKGWWKLFCPHPLPHLTGLVEKAFHV